MTSALLLVVLLVVSITLTAGLVHPSRPAKSAGWPSAANHRAPHDAPRSPTALHGKKKKGGGGGAANAPKKGKLHVQLLETVPNLGQKGDLLFVSSAVFQNQLKLTNKARLISEEEVQAMDAEREAEQQQMMEMARKTKAMLEEAMVENLGGEEQCDTEDICGVALEMKRKAGPEGNLFGGVNPKMVMEALKERYPDGAWDGKQVKLTDVKDGDGKDVKKKDIKHTGEYTMSVALGKDVDVTFILSISAE